MRSVSQSASTGLQMATARLARSARNVVVNNLGVAKHSVPTASEAVRLYLSGELPKSVLNPKVPELPQPVPSTQANDQMPPPETELPPEGTLPRIAAQAAEGMSIPPEADLARESVQQMTAVQSFRANVAMLKSDDERMKHLLEVKA